MLSLKHLGKLEAQDPYLGETLRAIQKAINQGHATAGVDPTGPFPTPAAPSSIIVTAANGWFDVSIMDSNPQRGLVYFIDYDTNPNFPAARTEYRGPTRNWYVQLGNQTLYWRCHSQYLGSNPSPFTVFGGSTPTPVVGGGASGPAPATSQGTGSGSQAGASPQPPVSGGFGPIIVGPSPRNLPGGRVQSLLESQ
jgi:hypothetical protein